MGTWVVINAGWYYPVDMKTNKGIMEGPGATR